MRRHGRGPGAEAGDLREALALQRAAGAHPARLVRPSAERPDLGQDGITLLDDVDVCLCRDRLPGGREVRVEVKHERVHLDAAVGRRDELEGRGEVQLFGGDVSEVEVLQTRED